MVLPGYCIGDLVENADFPRRQRPRDAAHRAGRREASPPSSASSITTFTSRTTTARCGNTTPRRSSATAASCSAREVAAAQLSLLRRQAVLHAWRIARAGRCRDRRADRSRVGVSICEDMWDEFYAVKPLPELSGKGATVLLNLNASPFYPGKRHERDALIRRHVAQLRKPIRLRQYRRRGRQRQERHPVRRREPRLRRARTAHRDRPQFEEELLVVDLEPGTTAMPRRSCRRSTRARDLRRAGDGLRDYMRKTGFTARSCRSRAASTRRSRWRSRSTRSAPDQVSAYNLPSQYNTDATRSIAERLRRALGVATASFRSRRSTTRSSARSSSTRTRSRAA